MAVVIGVDEAGFGPVLGPLVVSGAAFRVPDDRADDCLWKILGRSCTRRVTPKPRKTVVADSKKLYRPGGSMGLLERTALVTFAAMGRRPATFRALLELLADRPDDCLEPHPWYDGHDLPLPVCDDVGDIPTRANALRRDLADNGVELIAVISEPVTEGRFNRLLDETDNKATAAARTALGVVKRLHALAGNDRVRMHVDRLGGRQYYSDLLDVTFPGLDSTILCETQGRSAYALGRECEIEFVTAGDTKVFAIALASVFCKYVRELYMRLFNHYWSIEAPEVAPTAGYYNDAHRWLREAGPHIARLQIDRATLVRQR